MLLMPNLLVPEAFFLGGVMLCKGIKAVPAEQAAFVFSRIDLKQASVDVYIIFRKYYLFFLPIGAKMASVRCGAVPEQMKKIEVTGQRSP